MLCRVARQHVCIKVTYIETQFVTFDTTDLNDLVQGLTRKSSTTGVAIDPAPPPHKSRACQIC
jgi:hypothetical protein